MGNNYFVLILQIFISDFEKYFSYFPSFLNFFVEYFNDVLFSHINVIFQKSQNSYFDVEATDKSALVCL